MKRRTSLLALAATLAPVVRAQAQADYPNRPIRLVLGFAAGGGGDVVARLVTEEMSRTLGQPIVIENRPGAATNLASDYVAKAAPDGYTLLFAGSYSHSVNPALFQRLSFDVTRDFTWIGKVAGSPTVMVVPASLPVRTMAEFLAYARKEGDKVSFASSGPGSPGHIAGGYLNKFAGLQMTHIPYKGSSEALKAILSGDVQLIITSPPPVLAMVREGKLRALALTTAKPSPLLPGIPGAEEAGLRNFDIDGWHALWGPAGLPPAVTTRVHGALNQALAVPRIRERLESQGFLPDPSPSPEAFQRFGAEDRAKWATIVRESGARIE